VIGIPDIKLQARFSKDKPIQELFLQFT